MYKRSYYIPPSEWCVGNKTVKTKNIGIKRQEKKKKTKRVSQKEENGPARGNQCIRTDLLIAPHCVLTSSKPHPGASRTPWGPPRSALPSLRVGPRNWSLERDTLLEMAMPACCSDVGSKTVRGVRNGHHSIHIWMQCCACVPAVATVERAGRGGGTLPHARERHRPSELNFGFSRYFSRGCLFFCTG